MNECGFNIYQDNSSITVKAGSLWQATDIVTAPYPSFPSDLQAQFMVLMTQAQGTSIITENIFENRFMHVQELVRLNANISLKSRVVVIRGQQNSLIGANVMATDLRASACLILAGLIAQGETSINRIYHLDRGYESLDKKLASLGASIQRH